MTNTDDELRALIALGVLASFALVFQLSMVKVFANILGSAASPSLATLEADSIFVDSAFFGLYLALFSLAIGFKSFNESRSWAKTASDFLKTSADFLFLMGAFFLILVGGAFGYRIATAIF